MDGMVTWVPFFWWWRFTGRLFDLSEHYPHSG